nr:GDP-mannose 4,6-dehydratase [Arenimonas sp.]
MNILVTGGAGFIGSNFVQMAVAKGHRILNVDALTYAGNLESLKNITRDSAYVFTRADIADKSRMAELLNRYEPDAIVNFAAESHVDRSIDGPAAFIQTNVVGTLNLLECARDYWLALASDMQNRFRFLHVSTDEVYGDIDAPHEADE